jgi:RNA polymerase sigma-70 factor, ECF subfamily
MADALDERERGSSIWIDPALQFELLYEQENDYVSRTIRGIVRADAEVEDLVQECFARAYRARHRYRPDAPPGAWLHRIAVNTAISHLRRRRLDQVLSLDTEVPVADRDLQQAEARATLEEAMAGLSPKVRAAVVLKHFEDRSREEIAATLGIPSGTVASRVAKGMALLRSRLDEREEGTGDG